MAIDYDTYIRSHLETAVSHGDIEIWYQPQIRALSGQVCGFEALARWKDPELGYLYPNKFIPVLEKNYLIHKLDSFIVEEVCKVQSQRLTQGIQLIPISVNLSLEDFQAMDIVGFIDSCADRYQVPHNYIKIEITETMIHGDPESLHRQLDSLRELGFEVWLDDFGSGYSSLNVLKDYDLDLLKIDREFFSDFSQKSRSIIASIIRTSKDIGMRSLAEGVETEEQFLFLRKIGCDLIQGYYFGRPAPLEQEMEDLKRRGIFPEERSAINFWNEADKIKLLTDLPIALIMDDGESLNTVYISDAHLEERLSCGLSPVRDGEDYCPPEDHFFNQKAASFLRSLPPDGENSSELVNHNGNYIKLTAREVVRSKWHVLYLLTLSNISVSENQVANASINGILRDNLQLFNQVTVIDPVNMKITFFSGSHSRYSGKPGMAREDILDFASRYVYPDDRALFLEFADIRTLPERLGKNEVPFLSQAFRMRNDEGDYQWEELCFVTGSGINKDLVVSFRHTMPVNDDEIAHRVFTSLGVSEEEMDSLDISVTSEDLWRNLQLGSTIKFFWKDANRRFLGASRAFLNYYNLQDVKEIIGKTDDDIRWNVSPEIYRRDELDVLKTGRHVVASPGKCIVGGVQRDIVATKLPLFKNGKIVGLVGFFVDSDNSAYMSSGIRAARFLDNATGLLNTRGLIPVIRGYGNIWEVRGTDFTMKKFHLHGYRRLLKEYGPENTEKILRAVADKLRREIGLRAVLAYGGSGDIFTLYQADSPEDDARFESTVIDIIQSVRDVDGLACTFFADCKSVKYSDAKNTDAMTRLLVDKVPV